MARSTRGARRHRFDVSIERARAIQEELRGRVRSEPLRGPVRRVAGADVSYTRRAPRLFGAVVVLDAESGEEIERVSATAMPSSAPLWASIGPRTKSPMA